MFAGIKEDIKSVFDRDPAARSTFEVLTNYPGLHAIWWHRLNHKLWQANLKWLARFLSTIARWRNIGRYQLEPGQTPSYVGQWRGNWCWRQSAGPLAGW